MLAREPQRLGDRGEGALHLGSQHRTHLSGCDLLVVAALGEGLGDAHGRLDAEVSLDQQIFELLQGISIELPLGEEPGNILRQTRRGLGEPSLEALKPPLLPWWLRLALGDRVGRLDVRDRRLRRRLPGYWRRRRLRTAKEAHEAARFGGRIAHDANLGAMAL